MNIEEFREYCLNKAHVTESCPFGPETLVFKVDGKLFALTHLDFFESINLKCDPALALELRQRHPEATPGFHMNKKHWNTVSVRGSLEDPLIYSWIDHSYQKVIEGMSQKRRQELGF